MASGFTWDVTVRDEALQKLVRVATELGAGEYAVRAGVFADKNNGGDEREGVTNVELAAIHEMGTADGRVPARSFLRSTFEEQKNKYVSILRRALPRVLEGKLTARTMFDALGQTMVSDINHKVRSGAGVPPPLKPATIARKGSGRPLIDTGRLLAAITWVTTLGGRGE